MHGLTTSEQMQEHFEACTKAMQEKNITPRRRFGIALFRNLIMATDRTLLEEASALSNKDRIMCITEGYAAALSMCCAAVGKDDPTSQAILGALVYKTFQQSFIEHSKDTIMMAGAPNDQKQHPSDRP